MWRTERGRRLALPAVIMAEVFVLLVQDPRLGGDDPVRADMVRQLAQGEWPGVHFSVLFPLLAVPGYLLLQGIEHQSWAIERFGVVLWVLWSVPVSSQIARLRGMRVAVVFQCLAFCSLVVTYLVGFNAEFASMLAISGGLLAALTARRPAVVVLGWFLVVVGTANIPAQAPAIAVVCVLLAVRRRSLGPLAAGVASVCLVVAESSYHLGHLAFSKYEISSGATSPLLPWGEVRDFDHPLVFGLIAIVFSLGRGLVFYTPALFMSVRRLGDDLRDWSVALAVVVLLLIPAYAKWWAWYGGVTYGPRFFLLGCIPGAFAVAEILARPRDSSLALRLTAAVVACGSAWVGTMGVIYSITPGAAALCLADNYRLEPMCWYSAEYASWLAPLWDHGPVQGKQVIMGLVVIALVTPCLVLGLGGDARRGLQQGIRQLRTLRSERIP